MKKCFALLFFCSLLFESYGQILTFAPYLGVTNSQTGKKFKIKEGKRVEISSIGDSTIVYSKIAWFDGDSIHLRNKAVFAFSEIDYLSFYPTSKAKRVFKTAYYGTFSAALVFSIARSKQYNGGLNDAGSYGLALIAFSPLIIATGQIVGLIMQGEVSKQEFNGEKTFKIKPELSPIEY
jgi:hypothetical protein